MSGITRSIAGLIFLCIWLKAPAQPIWDLAQLNRLTTPEINLLRKEGGIFATIPKTTIDQAERIVGRLANEIEIPAPRVFLVGSHSLNAFAGPLRGQVTVGLNYGLLKATAMDPDALAAVVGHELAHLKLNHSTVGSSRTAVVDLIGAVASIAIGVDLAKKGKDPNLALFAGGIATALVNRKFDRDQEREADVLGVRTAASAGYDPRGAVRFWQLVSQHRGDGGGLLSTHPANSERMESLTILATALSSRHSAGEAKAFAGGQLTGVQATNAPAANALGLAAPTQSESRVWCTRNGIEVRLSSSDCRGVNAASAPANPQALSGLAPALRPKEEGASRNTSVVWCKRNGIEVRTSAAECAVSGQLVENAPLSDSDVSLSEKANVQGFTASRVHAGPVGRMVWCERGGLQVKVPAEECKVPASK